MGRRMARRSRHRPDADRARRSSLGNPGLRTCAGPRAACDAVLRDRGTANDYRRALARRVMSVESPGLTRAAAGRPFRPSPCLLAYMYTRAGSSSRLTRLVLRSYVRGPRLPLVTPWVP